MADTDSSVVETARASGFSAKYIRDLLYEDRVPGAHKVDGKWIIPAAAVEMLRKRKRGVN